MDRSIDRSIVVVVVVCLPEKKRERKRAEGRFFFFWFIDTSSCPDFDTCTCKHRKKVFWHAPVNVFRLSFRSTFYHHLLITNMVNLDTVRFPVCCIRAARLNGGRKTKNLNYDEWLSVINYYYHY